MWPRRPKPDPSWDQIASAHERGGEVSRACADILGMVLEDAGDERKALLLASAVEGEGKTTMALHLGAMLASRGRAVLLIDAHWHRPTLGGVLGVSDLPGLTDVLETGGSAEERVVPDRRLPRLSVLPRGTKDPDLLRPAFGDRLRAILERLKPGYDFLFLDGGPTVGGLGFGAVAPVVDGVVLVVACDRTQQTQLAAARHAVERHHGKLVGAVLNRVPSYLPAYYAKV